MRIDLREIKTYVITTNPVRRAFVEAQLATVGMTAEYVEGVRCSPKIVGCGLSHLKALSRGPTLPILILEDDIAVSEDFRPIVDVPYNSTGPDPNAIYLGCSSWGSDGKRGVQFGTRAEPYHLKRYGKEWLRVFNMCSSHAILYFDEGFATAARRMIQKSILDGIPFDVGLANLQDIHGERWWVITPRKPFFYQSAKVGGAEDATRHSLLDIGGLVLDGDQSGEMNSARESRAESRAFSLET